MSTVMSLRSGERVAHKKVEKLALFFRKASFFPIEETFLME